LPRPSRSECLTSVRCLYSRIAAPKRLRDESTVGGCASLSPQQKARQSRDCRAFALNETALRRRNWAGFTPRPKGTPVPALPASPLAVIAESHRQLSRALPAVALRERSSEKSSCRIRAGLGPVLPRPMRDIRGRVPTRSKILPCIPPVSANSLDAYPDRIQTPAAGNRCSFPQKSFE
jgi:hypothetical protein